MLGSTLGATLMLGSLLMLGWPLGASLVDGSGVRGASHTSVSPSAQHPSPKLLGLLLGALDGSADGEEEG